MESEILTIKDGVVIKCRSDAERVLIPRGVTKIEGWAFVECESMKEVEFEGTVAEWEGVKFCFAVCANKYVRSVKCADGVWHRPLYHIINGYFVGCFDKDTITSVTIPENVFEIWQKAFYDCRALESITFSKNIRKIGDDAFHHCHSLKFVEMGENVSEIGDCAFGCCQSLEYVVIPKGVTEIKGDTFWYCSSLKAVSLPPNVKKIGKSAFNNCSSLACVSFPSCLSEIGDKAFWQCKSLEDITFEGTISEWEAVKGKEMNLLRYVPAKSVKCADGVWQKSDLFIENDVVKALLDEKVEDVIIPEGATEIEKNVFEGCHQIKHVSIPSTMQKIGKDAFLRCDAVEKIESASPLFPYDEEKRTLFDATTGEKKAILMHAKEIAKQKKIRAVEKTSATAVLDSIMKEREGKAYVDMQSERFGNKIYLRVRTKKCGIEIALCDSNVADWMKALPDFLEMASQGKDALELKKFADEKGLEETSLGHLTIKDNVVKQKEARTGIAKRNAL